MLLGKFKLILITLTKTINLKNTSTKCPISGPSQLKIKQNFPKFSCFIEFHATVVKF